MDTTLAVTPSRAASALAYSWMVIKQFVVVGLVIPSVTAAMLIVLLSGFSFTEVSSWLVQSQVMSQQLGVATKPDHLVVKTCAAVSEVDALPPIEAGLCDEWVVHETPIDAVVASTARGLALAYLALVVFSGVLRMIFWGSAPERIRQHALFLSSLITRLQAKGGNRE